MEKFVIQGGVPLSGELTAAGNKNAALPILAACLLTEEELLLHRVPRIRDTEAQIALLERLGVEAVVGGRQQPPPQCRRASPRSRSTRSSRSRSAPRSCSPGRCWRASARRGCRRPGGDFIGRRRLDAHLDAFDDLGADGRGRPLDRADRAPRRAPRLRDLHGRALGDGHRERADGGGADARADDDLQRRLRAARPGPRPAADQDGGAGSTGSAPT